MSIKNLTNMLRNLLKGAIRGPGRRLPHQHQHPAAATGTKRDRQSRKWTRRLFVDRSIDSRILTPAFGKHRYGNLTDDDPSTDTKPLLGH